MIRPEVVRREIHTAIRLLKNKLESLHTVLNTRMDSKKVFYSEQHDVKIAKLEDLVRNHDGEKFRMEMQDKIDQTFLNLQKQIERIGGGHTC